MPPAHLRVHGSLVQVWMGLGSVYPTPAASAASPRMLAAGCCLPIRGVRKRSMRPAASAAPLLPSPRCASAAPLPRPCRGPHPTPKHSLPRCAGAPHPRGFSEMPQIPPQRYPRSPRTGFHCSIDDLPAVRRLKEALHCEDRRVQVLDPEAGVVKVHGDEHSGHLLLLARQRPASAPCEVSKAGWMRSRAGPSPACDSGAGLRPVRLAARCGSRAGTWSASAAPRAPAPCTPAQLARPPHFEGGFVIGRGVACGDPPACRPLVGDGPDGPRLAQRGLQQRGGLVLRRQGWRCRRGMAGWARQGASRLACAGSGSR